MPQPDPADRRASEKKMKATLVDTHSHLHRQEFDADRDEVIARAVESGVRILLDPATDLASNQTVIALSRRHPAVYAAIGLHPHDAGELTPAVLDELRLLAQQPKVVAIGEIGLDYYRDLTPRDIQKEVFKKFLLLGRELKLPVIIHCREAYSDLFPILRECLEVPMRGLLHCFAGDAAVAEEAVRLGLFISFAGNLTFPKAENLRDVAKTVPLDRVVLETDAPFLAPQAYRGKRNEPAYMVHLAQTWAELRNLAPEDVAKQTTANACRLFGIPEN